MTNTEHTGGVKTIDEVLEQVWWGDYQKPDGSWARGVSNQGEIKAKLEALMQDNAIEARMQTQFFLMSDLLTKMSPLMVHRNQAGFPGMTAEIIGELNDWRHEKYDEALKVVLPDKWEQLRTTNQTLKGEE